MAFERQWASIAPRAFTANGTTLGVVTVASTTGFRIKQVITLTNTAVPNSSQSFQVKQVLSKTQLVVGPIDQKIPGTPSDVSSFTVALGANISAGKQDKNAVPEKDHYSAVYEGDPVVADRVILVDENGEIVGENNPLPVNASVTVVVPPITVDIDAITPPTRPDPDNILMVGSEDGTKAGLKHAARIDSALDIRVGISNGANKANVSGSGDLSVRDSNADVLLSTRASEATLAALSAKFNSLGQKPMVGSVPVVLASDQSPIPVTASLADEPVKISGTINGQPNGTEFTFVNNLKLQILDSHDRIANFTYADFGTKNQRVTMIDYNSATFPGSTVRRVFAYTLVGNNYRRDSETWTIV